MDGWMIMAKIWLFIYTNQKIDVTDRKLEIMWKSGFLKHMHPHRFSFGVSYCVKQWTRFWSVSYTSDGVWILKLNFNPYKVICVVQSWAQIPGSILSSSYCLCAVSVTVNVLSVCVGFSLSVGRLATGNCL